MFILYILIGFMFFYIMSKIPADLIALSVMSVVVLGGLCFVGFVIVSLFGG